MMRSLNFWLFMMVVVCGISLVFASGVTLPKMGELPKASVPEVQNWQTDPQEQPVHLMILNGTEHNGLARQFSLLTSGHGCVVETIGNAPGIWSKSLLVNRHLDHDAAKDLARMMGQLPMIKQWDERQTEDAVLILGEDFAKVKAALAP